MPSLTARVFAVAMVFSTALFLSSCGARDEPAQVTSSDAPRITGSPAGYNAHDVAFAKNMITHHQQGIQLAGMVSEHAGGSEVVAFAAKTAATLESQVAVLRALRVQWGENPDPKAGAGNLAGTLTGMVDDATIARLDSLHGSEFDELWLQSMTRFAQGVIEMANGEIAHGENVDTIGLAKQIVQSGHDQIGEINQLSRS